MRKTISSTFVSLDGVINHMDRWHFDYIDAESDAIAFEQLKTSDTLLMGRRTYDAYASVWPDRDDPYAQQINSMEKLVASTTLEAPTWTNTRVLEGDLVDVVRGLKDTNGGDILMHGYGPVAKTLMGEGLLDELVLWIHPVLAGVGTDDDLLLRDGLHTELTTADVRTLDSGVVVIRLLSRR